MIFDLKLKHLAAGLCLAALTTTGYAAESSLDLSLPSSRYFAQDSKSFMLAANDTEVIKAKSNSAPVTPAAEFEPPLITGSNVHKYLGLGTIVLAGLTMVTNPGEGCEHNCAANAPRDTNGIHGQLGKATAAMAVATVASGLMAHWDDFSLEDGWSDPDNLHVLLGITGAALMAYAVEKSASQSTGTVSHAGMAEVGAIGMLLAIKLTW
jgi:hypothetical protein